MSGGYAQLGSLCNSVSFGAVLTGTGGTVVAPSATAHVKGSWVQFTASSPIDISYMYFASYFFSGTASNDSYAFDIAIGSSGNEKIICNNLIVSCQGEFNQPQIYYAFPISIPAGTRISVRCQAATASDQSVYVSLVAFDGAFNNSEGAAGIDSLGFSTTTTSGTTVTTGTNAKGSYAQLISSTTKDYIGFIVAGDTHGITPGTTPVTIDIAVGSSGNEKIILADLPLDPYATNINTPFFPLQIPSGTRIAARGATTTAVPFNLTLLGVYA